MPYPLPGAPPYSEELRWFLVAVPNERAFVQAALGAYTELGYFYKWGAEGKEEGRHEAAQAWKRAIAATLEALEMGFPDILLGHIDEVESLLAQILAKEVCCGQEVPGGGLGYTDYTYQDGEPVPPNVIGAGFATDANDQAGMAAYKCMISHLYVRNTAQKLYELASHFDATGKFLGGLSLVAAIAAALFIGATLVTGGALAIIAIEMLAAIGATAGAFSIVTEVGEDGLREAADELITNEEDYACAVYQQDGPQAGHSSFVSLVSTNLSATVAQLIGFVAPARDLAALYTGRYGDSDIAAEIAALGYSAAAFDCSCVQPVNATWTFDADNEGWEMHNGGIDTPLSWSGDNQTYLAPAQWNSIGNPPGSLYAGAVLRIRVSPAIFLPAGQYTYTMLRRGGNSAAGRHAMMIHTADGAPVASQDFSASGGSNWLWHTMTFTVPAGQYRLGVRSYAMYLDNVNITGPA